MSYLKRCPCGEVPESVGFTLTSGTFDVYGDCCGLWMVDGFGQRPQKNEIGEDLIDLAEQVWNAAPRQGESK